ncbi:hypothetical protein ABZ769_36910 [Streptomyces olivoreticuli]
MSILVFDEVAGVLLLGVQRVSGDDFPGQVQRAEQRLEPGDFIRLPVDVSTCPRTMALSWSSAAIRWI